MSRVSTRRSRLQDERAFNLSNPALFQAISQINPALGRNLAVALGNREIYNSMMVNTFRRGHHLYGESQFHDYLRQNPVPTEESILNDALQITRDPNTQEILPNPNFTSNNNAAIRFCTLRNYEECVRRLLRNPDVDVNVVMNGRTPLSYAISNGNVNIARALIARGANIDFVPFVGARETSLLYAFQSNNIDMLRYIVSLGFNTLRLINYLSSSASRSSYEIIDLIMRDYMNKGGNPQDNIVGEALLRIIRNNDEDERFSPKLSPQQLIQIFAFVFDYDGFNIANFRQQNDILDSACYLDDEFIPFVQFLISRGFQVRIRSIQAASGYDHYSGDMNDRSDPEMQMLRYLLSLIPVGQQIPQ